VGGAICMELVLRHAQNYMPPSQIAVVCQNSGRKYRWWSCLCLGILLLTGGLLVAYRQQAPEQDSPYWMILTVVCVVWIMQVLILAMLAYRIHPDMHLRVSASMSAAEISQERQRVAAAIVNMDIAVRVELLCALLAMMAGAALHLA